MLRPACAWRQVDPGPQVPSIHGAEEGSHSKGTHLTNHQRGANIFPFSLALLAEAHSRDCIHMLGTPAQRALPRSQTESKTSCIAHRVITA